ncbi:hypothetical protein [Chondromyces apiculatus]|uniref:Peptidase M61 catalytic domain-containing protein n=1 Tax=Chondromyces apiculatus DSM 436 TaxID=1192034 RepID=A0A017STD1_9BACT|nr:hypothetical protein [Chondromyces apiculatus]EYF00224.1 Hypothetical protein CAP_1066 [Chondromyces apiculatus DSM 436]
MNPRLHLLLSLASLASLASFASFALAAGCAAPPVAPLQASAAASALPAAALPGATAPITYVVKAGPRAEVLTVDMTLPPGPARTFRVEEAAASFVRDATFVALSGRGAAEALSAEGDTLRVPPCPGGCRVHYRFFLDEAAASLDDVGYAAERNGAYLAPPSTWLLQPLSGVPDPDVGRFRLRVDTPPGLRFVSGLFRAPDDPSVYEARLSDLPRTPYAAFGVLQRFEVAAPGGVVDVAVLPGAIDVDHDHLRRWVDDAARGISTYFGRFPVPSALVIILPTPDGRPGFSTALGNGGASVIARIGRSTTTEALARSWELTHEFVHLSFPNLHLRHSWLEEGLATYVEPIARARLGIIKPEEVWRGLALGLPKGLPEPDDRGLDHTPTWGRTYWGGALFCFLADLEIRERTGNARSLDDALRAIVAEGGNISVRWPIEQALDVGDRATGVTVLSDLYARWKDRPVDVDLDALWRRLGVRLAERRVFLDPSAPLAAIRDAIAAGPPVSRAP